MWWRSKMSDIPSPSRVAAKFKDKKEVPKADGKGTTTVYEYGPRQVANRHREKAERIESLRKQMSDLRAKIRRDLKSKDAKTRLTALAVALMDDTYERVGNEESAKKGHYGVTNWTVGHVTLSDKSATFKYVGKSGVKHEKKVENAMIIAALRKAVKGKGKDEKILCEGDDCNVLAKDVNEYLDSFGVTAKDIRGLNANQEVIRRLKEIRKDGPELPHSRKEKDAILKEEFQQAIEGAAEAVGHKPSTLRSQYLVPALEDTYIHDGTVIDKLNAKKGSAQRVGRRWATLSRSEKEERETERLVRTSPKKKPPRTDKERRRIKDPDEDRDPDKEQDRKDRSTNFKDSALRVARRYTAAKADLVTVRDKDSGRVVQVSEDTLRDQGGQYEAVDASEDNGDAGDEPSQDNGDAGDEPSKGRGPKDPKKRRDRAVARIDRVVPGHDGLLSKLTDAEVLAVARALPAAQREILPSGPVSPKTRKEIRQQAAFAKKVLGRVGGKGKRKGKPPSGKEIAEALVRLRAAEVANDPSLLDPTKPLSNLSAKSPKSRTPEEQRDFEARMADITVDALRSYRGVPQKDRDNHYKKLEEILSDLESGGATGSERHSAVVAQMTGLNAVSLLEDGDKARGGNPAFQAMLKGADNQGRLEDFVRLNIAGVAQGDEVAQAEFRKVLSDIPTKDLSGYLPDDHPAQEALQALSDDKIMSTVSPEGQAMLRELANDLVIGEVAFLDQDLVAKRKTVRGIKQEKSERRGPSPWIVAMKKALADMRRRIREVRR